MGIQVILFISLATLLCWWFILPVVNSLNIPVGETYGIISYVVATNRNPLTNIAIYLLLLLIPSIIVFAFTALRHRIVESFRFELANFNSYKVIETRLFPFLVTLGILIWVINATVTSIMPGLAQDPFHFGEKIGLTEAFFQSPKSFFNQGFLMIHGFGQNVLPGIVGWIWGGKENDIAFSLLTIHIQVLIAILFSFLSLYEIASFISGSYRWRALFLLSTIYFAWYGTVFIPIDRDTVFMIQAWLTLRWLRLNSDPAKEYGSFHPKICICLIGFFLPVGIIYVYDRAVYALAAFLSLLVYIFLTQGKRDFIRNAILAFSGILCAWLIISITLGFHAIPVSLSQIRYWSKVSGLFTSLPYPQIDVSIGSLLNWLPIFLQSITLTILIFKLRVECLISHKKFRSFLIENNAPIFLLLCAMLFMRVALGRSDGGHLVSPGFFAIFAFFALVGKLFSEQGVLQRYWGQVFAAVLIATIAFNMNSVFTAVNLRGVLNYPSIVQTFTAQTNSSLLNPIYLDTARQIQPELSDQSCFYTLTSEGLWYRLLNKQPCSKYWYLIYSTTESTQEDLIQDLEKTKPQLILYSNSSLGNGIDGIWKESSHLTVHQYIWQNYRPYKLIGDQWFWIRRSEAVSLSDLLVASPKTALGYFDGLRFLDQTIKSNITAQGWMIPEVAPIAGENDVVLLTYHPVGSPQKHSLLGLARTSINRPDTANKFNRLDAPQSGWSITFNRLNLPDHAVRVRAWAYNPKDQRFHLLPKGHLLEPNQA